MKDIEIIKQLLDGNHLSDSELKRASEIVNNLKIHIEARMDIGSDKTNQAGKTTPGPA